MNLPINIQNIDSSPNSNENSNTSIKCRICFSPEPLNLLISPCNCKGTVANVHIQCLENWLTSIRNRPPHCEICKYKYKIRRVPLHNIFTSLLVWYGISNHRIILLDKLKEILLLIIITIISVGFIACICCLREPFFIPWIKVYYIISILALLYVNLVSIVLTLDRVIVMWYIWWKSTHTVKLMPAHIKKSITHTETSRKCMKLMPAHIKKSATQNETSYGSRIYLETAV